MATAKVKQTNHHILLEDTPGYFMPGAFSLASHVDPKNLYPVPVKKGTLVYIPSPDGAAQFLPEILVQSSEADTVYVRCKPTSIVAVSEREYNLLIAISQMFIRFKVYRDKAWIADGNRLAEGDLVRLVTKNDLEGRVRYKGELQNRQGIWFGLELKRPGDGDAYSDGVYDGARYFKTNPKCGIFVNLGDIRLLESKMRTAPAYLQPRGMPQQRDHHIPPFLHREMQQQNEGADYVEDHLRFEMPRGFGDNRPASSRKTVTRQRHTVAKSGLFKENKNQLVKLLTRDNKKIIEVLVLQNIINEDSSQVLHTIAEDKNRTQLMIDILGADANKTLKPFVEVLDMLDKTFAANLLRDGIEEPGIIEERNNDIKHMEGFDNIMVEPNRMDMPEYMPIDDQMHAEIQRSASLNEFSTAPWVTAERMPRKMTQEDNTKDPVLDRAAPRTVYESPEPKHSISPGNRNVGSTSPKKMDIGSMVEVMVNGRTECGVIKWLGKANDSPQTVAGLEMENVIRNGTSGIIGSKKLYECERGRGFFTLLKDCRPDSRFFGTEQENTQTPDIHRTPTPTVPTPSGRTIQKPVDPVAPSVALDVGSRVTIDLMGREVAGIIKWIGTDNPQKPWAGLEMEEEIPNGNNGFHGKERKFFCLPRRGHFCLLSECKLSPNSGENDGSGTKAASAKAAGTIENQTGAQMSESFMVGHTTDRNSTPMWKSMVENNNQSGPTPVTSTPKPQSQTPLPSPVSPLMTQSGVFIHHVQPKVIIPTSLDPWKLNTEFGLGSVVEVTLSGLTHQGVIRWIGYTSDPDKPMAGLEMSETLNRGNNGFLGQTRIFHCKQKQGLFLLLSKCRNIKTDVEPPKAPPVFADAAQTPTNTSTSATPVSNVKIQEQFTKADRSSPPQEYIQRLPPIMVDPRHIASQYQHLQLGSLVEVTVNGRSYSGAIRWFGYQGGCDMKTLLAGIETNEDNESSCDGMLDGTQIFICRPKRGMIVAVSECRTSVPGAAASGASSASSTGAVSAILGSRVIVDIYGKHRSGTIRWTGTFGNSTKPWAGLEMDEDKGNHDGILNNVRLFTCSPGRGLFVLLSKCQPLKKEATAASPVSRSTQQAPRMTSSLMTAPAVAHTEQRMAQSVALSSSPDNPPCNMQSRIPVAIDPAQLPYGLQLESAVELTLQGKSSLGIIKWVGHCGNQYRMMAGVEMMEEFPNGNSGMLNQTQLFQCPPKKGIFTLLSKCKPVDL